MPSTEIVNSLMTAELLDPLDLRTVRARLIWEPSWTCWSRTTLSAMWDIPSSLSRVIRNSSMVS